VAAAAGSSSGSGARPVTAASGGRPPRRTRDNGRVSTTLLGRADVEAAAARLAGIALTSPLQPNLRLSALTGAEVFLKREDLQPVRSYKLRGAYNFIDRLPAADRSRGVVCASAGNHAQGVALACALLGIDGWAYLPRTTPRQKRDRIEALGEGRVQIRAVGDTYDEASDAAAGFAGSEGATLVPAFDAADTIAGQGTVIREVEQQLGRTPEVIVVPVGGGGLLAGTSAWLSGQDARPRLIGVEPSGAASMAAAMRAGGPVPLEHVDTFVDGAAVRQVGAATYAHAAASGVELLTVAEGALCTEMIALYQSDGIIAEPAGALAPAALSQLEGLAGSTAVCVLSGGNNDLSRYPEILERSLVHLGLKHYFLVEFPQEPGALRSFLDEALGPDDDITLFEYVKRSNRETGPALVGIELARREDLDPLLDRLDRMPFVVERVQPDHALFRFLV
jgi:threonine dehydratase